MVRFLVRRLLTVNIPSGGLALLIIPTAANTAATACWNYTIGDQGFLKALWGGTTSDSLIGTAFSTVTNYDLTTGNYMGLTWQHRLMTGVDSVLAVGVGRVGMKLGKTGGERLNRYGHEKGWLPCFPAGTKLKTPEGWKAVEDFRVGDEIVSRPEDNSGAENTVRKVVKLLTRSGRLMTLRVRGQAIETTHEHPWWVVGKGWVTANNLAAGDVFVTSEHAEVVLESVEDADRYVAVYNLTVEADHTYFVGDEGWGFDVWSHNHHDVASGHGYVPRDASGNPKPLPRTPTGEFAPTTPRPHTQIGWQEGRKGGYRQTQEFGENGKPVKIVDWTNHGRPGQHTNPHVHDYVPNPTGGTPIHGPARPPHPGELGGG